MKLSKNFTHDEFECPHCSCLIYDESFIVSLQKLRDQLGVPFHVSSGYRCYEYNQSLINSSPNSQHLKGRAADIVTVNWSSNLIWTFINKATDLGLSIGVYENHIHVDNRLGDQQFWIGSY